ncbi:PRELI domain-containing protein 2 [Mactra antiquata]
MVVTIDVHHVYKYPLELVVQTHFTKYPSKKEKFVKKVEVVERKINYADGVKYRRSIAFCENVIPSILRTIGLLNVNAILLEEESWLNERQHRMEVKSKNMTWSKYAHLWEKSVFRAHETNPSWTVFEQHGSIDVHGIGRLGRVIEMFAERFLHSGVQRSLNIMEDLLKERYNKDIDHKGMKQKRDFVLFIQPGEQKRDFVLFIQTREQKRDFLFFIQTREQKRDFVLFIQPGEQKRDFVFIIQTREQKRDFVFFIQTREQKRDFVFFIQTREQKIDLYYLFKLEKNVKYYCQIC